jgi:hypothetical protein
MRAAGLAGASGRGIGRLCRLLRLVSRDVHYRAQRRGAAMPNRA